MSRNPFAVLGAATIVAALALSGCSNHDESKPATSPVDPSVPAISAPSTTTALPAPEALTDVLYRLADPSVKGSDKLTLVEGTTPDDAATIDKFAAALRDGGFTPLTFTAADIRWSDRQPDDALATINVTTPNPANPGGFTFPMEFRSHQGSWQLSRQTAEMLLAFGNARTEATGASPRPPDAPQSTSSSAPTPTP